MNLAAIYKPTFHAGRQSKLWQAPLAHRFLHDFTQAKQQLLLLVTLLRRLSLGEVLGDAIATIN